MIRTRSLSAYYLAGKKRVDAFSDVSLDVGAGEICAVLGPSGCGKSTLLKVLAGIHKSFDGTAEILGGPIDPSRLTIGFMPQNYGLLPWKTIRENILLGCRVKNRLPDEAEYKRLVAELGLSGMERRYPGELSGGQRQRAALARAFLLRPDVLLMDEPFSALDAITREAIRDVFLSLYRASSVTTVIVTHQIEEALYLGQALAVMSHQPGKLTGLMENPYFGRGRFETPQSFFDEIHDMLGDGS